MTKKMKAQIKEIKKIEQIVDKAFRKVEKDVTTRSKKGSSRPFLGGF